ncbi:hypothetical protein WJ97_11045 [Burkholderia ubonensis]|nr:hypothetical protein WJ97_11045 [Burkholderia ubonensis]
MPSYTLTMQPKLIFLDFDGVLHPCTAGTFIYVGRFQAFLRQHPCLRVVLSTSWRNDHAWDDLMALFSPDMRERFVGATPQLSETLPAAREQEIQAWLRAHGCERVPWVAVDDDVSLFTPGCQRLVQCETIRGLRPAQLAEVATKLALTQ